MPLFGILCRILGRQWMTWGVAFLKILQPEICARTKFWPCFTTPGMAIMARAWIRKVTFWTTPYYLRSTPIWSLRLGTHAFGTRLVVRHRILITGRSHYLVTIVFMIPMNG